MTPKNLMQGKGDPGYWFTSRALLETGLCLVQQVQLAHLPSNGAAAVLAV